MSAASSKIPFVVRNEIEFGIQYELPPLTKTTPPRVFYWFHQCDGNSLLEIQFIPPRVVNPPKYP